MTATKTDRPAGARDVLASLPRLDRHKPKGPPVRRSKASRWRAAVLIAVHVVIGLHVWHWLATGESLTPVEPSEAMETVELGRINAGFVLFLALIASTLLFGRWFCGWACHVVALQDLSAWLLGRAGLKPKPVRSRLLVFAPWVVGGYMFVWPVVSHALWPPDDAAASGRFPSPAEWRSEMTTTDLWQTFPGPIMAVATFVVVGFLVVWWLGAKGFCTYGCPYGAFFATADRVAPIRIKVDKDACEACGHCTTVCSSNVRVHEEVAKYGKVVDPGCMKCLDCVSVCPKDALSVGFAAPKPFALSQQRIRARADFEWWEEVLLAVVAVVAAQWVFRGAWFVEKVPLLLSVGLGVSTAIAALLLVRLLGRRDVAFQHSKLKVDGAYTRGGLVASAVVVVWLSFAGHTAWANAATRDAEQAVAAADPTLRRAFYDPRSVDLAPLDPALDALETAQGRLWVRNRHWTEWRGVALRVLGRHGDAEAALLDALGDRNALQLVEANLALAAYDMDPARRRYAQARRLVAAALERVPDHRIGLVLQQRLERLPR